MLAMDNQDNFELNSRYSNVKKIEENSALRNKYTIERPILERSDEINSIKSKTFILKVTSLNVSTKYAYLFYNFLYT